MDNWLGQCLICQCVDLANVYKADWSRGYECVSDGGYIGNCITNIIVLA